MNCSQIPIPLLHLLRASHISGMLLSTLFLMILYNFSEGAVHSCTMKKAVGLRYGGGGANP